MPSEIRVAITIPATDDKREQSRSIAKLDPLLADFEAAMTAAGIVGAKTLVTCVTLRPEKTERKPVVVQQVPAPPAEAAD